MATRSWLRTHKKRIITHISIIVGFALLTILVSQPLFDRLERIPGEAQLQRLQLPDETNDIRCNIDEITVHSQTIYCWGWAFIEGHDVNLELNRTYIVLKSDRHTYIFDTAPRERPAVTRDWGASELNLDWSGFLTSIPLRKIARGSYTVGFYITKGDIEALQYTGWVVEC